MAFGRRKQDDDAGVAAGPSREQGGAAEADDEPDGPFDIDDFEDPAAVLHLRHDLGSVLIPTEEAAELAVEVNQQGVPTMVWMMTPHGRYNITAYAAPKTGSLWREVITELAESLRGEGAQVSFEEGPWGRELVGLMTKGPEPMLMRFIGVDGYRWMIRGTAMSAPDGADAIASKIRSALADTVVRRGEQPLPVRNMLPLQLSDDLVARLRARAEQMAAEQAAAGVQPAAPQPPAAQPVARRSEQGSAMQQLRTITGG